MINMLEAVRQLGQMTSVGFVSGVIYALGILRGPCSVEGRTAQVLVTNRFVVLAFSAALMRLICDFPAPMK